jgi:hypothetical protein
MSCKDGDEVTARKSHSLPPTPKGDSWTLVKQVRNPWGQVPLCEQGLHFPAPDMWSFK